MRSGKELLNQDTIKRNALRDSFASASDSDSAAEASDSGYGFF